MKQFHNFIFLKLFALMGLPKSFSSRIVKNLDQDRRRDVYGFLVWLLRYKLRLGHRSSAINPSEFCQSVEHSNYFMTLIERTSKTEINKNGLLVSKTLRNRLAVHANEKLIGSIPDSEKLRVRIVTYLQSQLIKSDNPVSLVDPKTLYEIEGRSGFDTDVQTFVRNSLSSKISKGIKETQTKYTSKFQALDDDVFSTLYSMLDDLGFSPFLCSHSLLSFVKNDWFANVNREIHIGVFCQDSSMPKIWNLMTEIFTDPAAIITKNSHLISVKQQAGPRIFIWRYENVSAHSITKDHINTYVFTRFQLKKMRLQTSFVRMPDDTRLYLSTQFGIGWEHAKLYISRSFDYKNTFYNNTPEALNFLTETITVSLSEKMRTPLSRAIEDLSDNFDIEYTAYLPSQKHSITTPGTLRRRAYIQNTERSVIIIVNAHMPNCETIISVNSLAQQYSSVTVSVLNDPKLNIIEAFKILKNIDEVIAVDSKAAWEKYFSKRKNVKIYVTRLAKKDAHAFGILATLGEQ